ncbi:hypothetical protein BKA70DRAFT_1428734 [Coprinopsis sp. MPI-PUGE-AT-0042]|nr:hypothetical protein BKA70DRAFT_1428734 [Coprinopsis sp. MPI-PUGE-AT-0042]
MLSMEACKFCFVGLPASKSFLRIINVPWFSNVTKNILTTCEHVESVFKRSTLGRNIWMTGPVCLVRDSVNAMSGTAYFDIWDSQTGAKAKCVINRPLEIHGHKCNIWPARASDPNTVVAAMDASVPSAPCCQAMAAAMVYYQDAELSAIRTAVECMTQSYPAATWMVIFMDSMAAAKLSIDLSAHSGQGHSLAVCKNLSTWFNQGGKRKLTFVYVPSIKEWNIHKAAHTFVGGLPLIYAGAQPQTSLDRVRKDITSWCLDSWMTQFQNPTYSGHNFL